MKMKSLMLLAVAVGCGLVALLGVQQVLSSDRGEKVEKVRVLVARMEIEPGVPLGKDNVDFREVPKEGLPENAVTKIDEYEERALISRAYPNQVICLPQLGEKGVYGAAINIPDGMRVVTIPVNATTTHSGMLKPGDRVDVLATFQLQRPGLGSVTRTKTILEYIEIFATDSVRSGVEEPSKQSSAKDGVKNVSLLVSPKQANVLKLAENKGTVHLALRSKTDILRTDKTDIDESNLESLEALFDGDNSANRPNAAKAEPPLEKPTFGDYLAKPEQEEPVVSAKPTWKVTIYNGEKKEVQELELPEPETPAQPEQPEEATSQQTGGHWIQGVGRFFGVTTNK
jgi:pilus assembly protein CpaB